MQLSTADRLKMAAKMADWYCLLCDAYIVSGHSDIDALDSVAESFGYDMRVALDYIRVNTNLCHELRKLILERDMSFSVASELSRLPHEQQLSVHDGLRITGICLTARQADILARVMALGKYRSISVDKVVAILRCL